MWIKVVGAGLLGVVVCGASGRMGQELLSALCRDPDLRPVGAVEREIKDGQLSLPDGSGVIPFSCDLDSVLKACHPDVVVDFTIAEATMPAVRTTVKYKVNLVIGTTGLAPCDLDEIDHLARANEVGAVVAPNFALGAVVMIHLAKVAAKFFDYAEIIEMHHEKKVDSPSGTALSTARAMLDSRGAPFLHSTVQEEGLCSARGEWMDGIALHSVRLPGILASQEVLLGAPGQLLAIRHDALDRECYMPGVLLAIKRVVGLKGLTYGLDTLLGL